MRFRSAIAVLAVLLLAHAAHTRADQSAYNDRYVPTPVGRILRECSHKVPNGAIIEELSTGETMIKYADGTLHAVLPKCDTTLYPLFDPAQHAPHRVRSSFRDDPPFPADYDGWLAYTAYNSSVGFDAFLGYFDVPSAPAQDPDILYLFTGLQNIDWIPKRDPDPGNFDIIQPVLQYPGDAGNYWSVKSWYVTLNAGSMESPEVKLTVKDNIFGNMTRTGAQSWYVGSTSVSSGKTTSITANASRLATQVWAYNTLECYGCIDCSTYPSGSPIHFTKLQLIHGNSTVDADWLINPKPNPDLKCKESVDVIDPQTVTINFGNE